MGGFQYQIFEIKKTPKLRGLAMGVARRLRPILQLCAVVCRGMTQFGKKLRVLQRLAWEGQAVNQ
jgi:hypothetical protein